MKIKSKNSLAKGLTQKKNGNFQLRIVIAEALKSLFNRSEFKKTYDINKNLTIKDILDDVNKIKNEYEAIRDKFKMRVLSNDEIQDLVNKFIIDNLNEDYEARINGSIGGTFGTTGVDATNEPIENQTLTVMDLVLSELRESLINPREQLNSSVINSLLSTLGTSLSELDETTQKELNYCLKQATMEILEEQIARSKGTSKAKRLKLNTKPKTVTVLNEAEDIKLTVAKAIKDYLEVYEQSNSSVSSKTFTEKDTALEYFKAVMDYLDIQFVEELKKTSIDIYVNKFLKLKPKQSTAKLRALTYNDIIVGIDKNEFQDLGKIATNTVDKQYQHISGFCNYLFNDGVISRKINQVTVGQELTNRDEFTVEEVKTILDGFEKLDKPFFYEFFSVYCYTGIRNNELWQSTIEKDIITGITYFDVKGTKTDDAPRKIPLHSKLIEMGITNKWLEALKTKYSTSKYICRKVRETFKTMIVDKNKTLYSCRHFFTTELLKAEVDENIVDKLTGHSDKKNLTISTYGKNAFTLEKLKIEIEKMVI